MIAKSVLSRRLSRFDDYEEVVRLYPLVSPWVRLYFALRFLICPFRRVESVVPKSGVVVDIGCGYGLFANLLAVRSGARHVIGYDTDAARINVARASVGGRNNISFSVSNEVAMPPSCDAVTLLDVLHHVAPDARLRLLQEVFQKLRPGGDLVIKDIDKTPRFKYLWNYLHDWAMTQGKSCYYLGNLEMRRLLEEIGFVVVAEPLETHDPYPHILYRCTKPELVS
jgi:2-polyprenyl-3-methyl-5-hydroxy-6-metoxy-1,4-benzoquinol methylase